MTFQEFCVGSTIVSIGLLLFGLLVIRPLYMRGGKGRDFWDDVIVIPSVLLPVVGIIVSCICWGTYASAYADEVKDRNYCESLEDRGHDSLFARYNQFNHDCFILVDEQWIRIEDSAWGKNA